MKPQVSLRFGEYCQVAESRVTEPGLQADSLPPCARVLRRCGAEAVLKKVEAEGVGAENLCHLGRCSGERSPVSSAGRAGLGPSGRAMIFGLWA